MCRRSPTFVTKRFLFIQKVRRKSINTHQGKMITYVDGYTTKLLYNYWLSEETFGFKKICKVMIVQFVSPCMSHLVVTS